MKTVNNDLKKYYRSIKKALLGSSKDKKRLLNDLKNRVYDFLTDNPSATIYTIEKHFGSPQVIADEFNANLTLEEIKCEKSKRKLKYIMLALAALAFIAVVVLVVYIMVSNYKNRPIYYGDSVEEINTTQLDKNSSSTDDTDTVDDIEIIDEIEIIE